MIQNYKIDLAHSSISFTVKHMLVYKVNGSFKKFSGNLSYDVKTVLNSKLDITLDIASIDTNDKQRDNHLKSTEFFNIEKFPLITYKSNNFAMNGKELVIKGDLAIHGVCQKLNLQIKVPIERNEILYIEGICKIKRKDFGLTWHGLLEAPGLLVGDDIDIKFKVQATKTV